MVPNGATHHYDNKCKMLHGKHFQYRVEFSFKEIRDGLLDKTKYYAIRVDFQIRRFLSKQSMTAKKAISIMPQNSKLAVLKKRKEILRKVKDYVDNTLNQLS